jgi:hypothetical protein
MMNNSEPMISKNVDVHSFPCRQMVGALMYLSTGRRPDIAYSAGVASRNLENPSQEDCTLVERIFRYLKHTSDYSLVYKSNFKQGILESYSDADYGGDL